MEKVIHCEEDQDSIIIEVRDVTSKAFMSTYYPQLESFSEPCCSTYCLQKHCYELYPYFGNVVSACLCVQGGFWVVTTPSTEAQAYLMHFYTCPAGYCRCVQNSSLSMQNCVYLYVNSNPDAQCSCNRKGITFNSKKKHPPFKRKYVLLYTVVSGILCGTCKDQGVSVLFDKCTTCSSSHSILIPILSE